MGPKNSKGRASFSFARKLQYYSESDFKPLQFQLASMNMNSQLLPNDLLHLVFFQIGEISTLLKVSRVCQLYSLSLEDVHWLRFLKNQKRTFLCPSARAEVVAFFRSPHLCVHGSFDEKVRGGYEMRKGVNSVVIVVLGIGGVGKSAVTCQFANGVFVEQCDPTLEEMFTVYRSLHDKHQVQFDVLDTAGCEQSALRDYFLQSGHAFFVVYSVADSCSFSEVELYLGRVYSLNKFADQCVQYEKPVILVGNKLDLRDGSPRQVSYSEGYALAKQWQIGFIEVSAKTKENIDTLFCTTAELVMLCRMGSKASKVRKLV